jgi:hypothetical protein
MDNHYHLILRPSSDDFSRMMRNLNSTYARYVNKSRKRRGYVFFDRFKSIPTRNRNYLRRLLFYVHANPLRAGTAKSINDLGGFAWTSHREYLDPSQKRFGWLQTDYFSKLLNSNSAKDTYLEQLSNYLGEEFDPWQIDEQCDRPNVDVPQNICSTDALWIRQKITVAEQLRIRMQKLQKRPKVIQELLKGACLQCGVSQADIFRSSKRRTVSRTVQLFSYWAVRCAGFSAAFIGRVINRSGSAILRAAELGEGVSAPLPISV